MFHFSVHLTLQKEMFLHGISMQIILPEASVEDPLESIRRMQFGSVVLFLDLECGGAIHVMEQVSIITRHTLKNYEKGY